jgi:hypothetical protein
MLEMVEARMDADKVEEHYDLFTGLLDAAQDEPGNEAALSDDELIGWYSLSDRSAFIQVALPSLPGNMFIFLLAGHEVRSFPSFCVLSQYSSHRVLRIHYASHLRCWRCILANKRLYINT